MNINRVYVANIYAVTRCGFNSSGRYSYFGRKIKRVLVYKSKDGSYIDLETRERYSFGISAYTEFGDLIIDTDYGLIPVASVIVFDRINMSRRKILKKYNEVMEVKKNEESI